MRYLIACLLLAPLSASAQTVVGSYTGTASLLAYDPIADDTVFRLRLNVPGGTIFDTLLPFHALNNSAWSLPGQDFLTNGTIDGITVRLRPETIGSLDGALNFFEHQITYAYEPHIAADFQGEAAVQEIQLSLLNVSAHGTIAGYRAKVDFIGYKLAAVPEPGTWVLCLVGISLLIAKVRSL